MDFFDTYSKEYNFRSEVMFSHGVVNGYHISLNRKLFQVFVNAFLTEANQAKAKTFVASIKATSPMKQFTISQDGIGFRAFGAFKNPLYKAIDTVTNFLKEISAEGTGFCSTCGQKTENMRIFALDKIAHTCDDECLAQAQEKIAEFNAKSQESVQKGSYARGIVGAVIAALVGCAGVAIFPAFEFMGAIFALFTGFIASLLYDKFGGKIDKRKPLIVCGITVGSILLTVLILVSLSAQATLVALGQTPTFFEAMASIFKLLTTQHKDYLLIVLIAFETIIGVALGLMLTLQHLSLQAASMNKQFFVLE